MGGVHARDADGWPDDDDKSGMYPIEGERWYTCDYCGWIFPESQTAIEKQTGLRACLSDPGDFNSVSEDKDYMRSLTDELLFNYEENDGE